MHYSMSSWMIWFIRHSRRIALRLGEPLLNVLAGHRKIGWPAILICGSRVVFCVLFYLWCSPIVSLIVVFHTEFFFYRIKLRNSHWPQWSPLSRWPKKTLCDSWRFLVKTFLNYWFLDTLYWRFNNGCRYL